MLIVENRAKIEAMFILLQFALVMAIRGFLFQSIRTSGIWEWLLFSLVFFALLPWLTIRYIFKHPAREYNFRWSIFRSLSAVSITTLVIMLAGLALVVLKLNWKSILPVFFWVQGGVWLTLFVDVCLLSLVILSQEFFFRGYWHETVKRAWGMKAAILGSAFFSFIYAYVSLADVMLDKVVYLIILHFSLSLLVASSRSVVLTALVHWTILIFIDLYAVYNLFS